MEKVVIGSVVSIEGREVTVLATRIVDGEQVIVGRSGDEVKSYSLGKVCGGEVK